MKLLKKLAACFITIVMFLGMTTAVSADGYSITIKNENTHISINGKTYSAYKLFDSSHEGTDVDSPYSYTMSTASQFYSADLLETSTTQPADGTLAKLLKDNFKFTAVPGDTTKVNVEKKGTFEEAEARAFADAIQKFLSGKTATATSQAAANETCTIDLSGADAGEGYYLVTGDAASKDDGEQSVVSAVIITNANPNPTVNPKADVPTLDKKITGVTNGGAKIDDTSATAAVGSTVSFELDSIVPDLTGYSSYTFTFHDKVTSGLDYVTDPTSFKLKINDAEVTVDRQPVVSKDGKSFTYTIPYDTLKTYTKGNAIALTYDCVVNSSAVTYDYDNNTAQLEYSHSPYDSTTQKTPEKKTYVLNVDLNVKKVAGSANGKNLSDAEFRLYKMNGTVKNYYKLEETTISWVADASQATTFKTNDQGVFTDPIKGLGADTYYLEEITAPKGYNLLDKPVEVKITAVTSTTADTVTVSATGAAVTGETVNLAVTQAETRPLVTATVINNSGSVLPSTGGMGTKIFYVVGAGLIVVAGVLLVSRRKMNS